MSSIRVRNKVFAFLAANAPTEKVVDMSAQTGTLEALLSDNGINEQPWLGITFLAGDEQPITIPATNSSGTYRETGGVYFHVVDVGGSGVGASLLSRGEALRNMLRGMRIDGTLLVDTVTPMSFDAGGTLKFDATYTSGSFLMSFQNDYNL